jgi:Zn-dependent peptidase ImmA (M78 family)/transcriptional regulator with XRE-family HTH domain
MDVTEIAVGRRIRALREKRSLRAQDLAAQLGLSPSSWSRIESGDRSLKTAELVAIAAALDVSPLALLEEDGLLARLPLAARGGEGAGTDGAVFQRVRALAELDDVLRHAGHPAVPHLDEVPGATTETWLDSADRLARWARDRLSGEAPSFETPVSRWAFLIQDRLGIDVIVEPHDDQVLGASITDWSFPLIFVNGSQVRPRALFTLAHELGHVLAGSDAVVQVDDSLDTSGPEERLANAFAAGFLMPESEVHEHIDRHGRGVEALAQMILRFGVSYESLVYRLHNLRIINAEGRDRLRSLGGRGLLARVEEDQGLFARLLEMQTGPTEHIPPLLLVRRTLDAYWEGDVSVRPLAGLLHLDPDDLQPALEERRRERNEGADPLESENYADVDPSTSDESLFAGSPI